MTTIAIRHREPNGRHKRPSEAQGKDRRAVYVMRAATSGAVKIGSSNSPARRASAIETGSPVAINIAAVIWLSHEDANRLERAFHNRFRGTNRHMRGEWYSMREGEACFELWMLADEMGIAVRLERGMNFDEDEFGGLKRDVISLYERRLERKRYG